MVSASSIQFVDEVSASANVLLDINRLSSGLMVAPDGIDLSPPPLRRAVSSTLMMVGERIGASAPGNRTLKLTLRLLQEDAADSVASILAPLVRELDKETNLVRIQLAGVAEPVFLRTYRASDVVMSMIRLWPETSRHTLEIPCYPYGVGLRRQATATKTFTSNPATEFNSVLDIDGVIGDMPTPAFVRWTFGTPSLIPIIAVRTRGIPSNLQWFAQAEAFTGGTDTAIVVGNNANASGAGNNTMLTTFATPTFSARLTVGAGDKFPPGVAETAAHRREWPGLYRVFTRTSRSAFTGVINVAYQAEDVGIGPKTSQPSGGGFFLLDLGLLEVGGSERGYDGYKFPSTGPELEFWAERIGGTDTLTWDYVELLPADQHMVMFTAGDSSVTEFMLDGPNDRIYGLSGDPFAADIYELPSGSFRTSEIPKLYPGFTNRWYCVDREAAGIAATATATIYYWPQFAYPFGRVA